MIPFQYRAGEGRYVTLDFENDTRYLRDIDGVDLEPPRPLTDEEWQFDDELNEPVIEHDDLMAEVMKNRAYIRELAKLLRQHTSVTLADLQAAKATADAAPEKKRQR